MKPLLIFDFDGVVADTEVIANRVLAQALTDAGLATTIDESFDLYLGRRWADNVAAIEARYGGPLPADFNDRRRVATRAEVAVSLSEVAGLSRFLDAHEDWPRCIASSSTRDWIGLCLDRLGLGERFEHRFSGAEDVEHGKPAPDLFLHAARSLGHAPADCIVIEDSRAGVRGGIAAGMTVAGLTAGSHARPGDAALLIDAGATLVVDSYVALANWLAR